MHFPQALDIKKSLYKYANSTSIGLPFQVAIDLRTMTIVGTKKGKATLSEVEALAKKTLDGK